MVIWHFYDKYEQVVPNVIFWSFYTDNSDSKSESYLSFQSRLNPASLLSYCIIKWTDLWTVDFNKHARRERSMLTRVTQWRACQYRPLKLRQVRSLGWDRAGCQSVFMFVHVCVDVDVAAHTNKECKWKDTSEVKLEPLVTISLIGLRGQQGSVDGSITLSIWWPSHIGLANRGPDAGRTRSPSLRLSYCAFHGYVTLTQKNLSDHLCWFTFGLHCPVNPLDQLKRTFLMQEDLCCKLLHSGKIRVHEMWHWNGVFVLDISESRLHIKITNEIWYVVWYF